MTKLKYTVPQISNLAKEISIDNDSFICVESWRNGITFLTAFIGKGEGNREKMKIEVSSFGGFFNVTQMAGSSMLNAKSLLEKDHRNMIVKKELFLSVLRINSHYANDALELLI